MIICHYCRQTLRREGPVLVSHEDDSPRCPDAPLIRCSYCQGAGCGSCEGYGEIYGPHVAND